MFNRKDKKIIAQFLYTSYSDESLRKLLVAAKGGWVQWSSPSQCLVGMCDDRTVHCVYSSPAQAYFRLGYSVIGMLGMFIGDFDGDRHRNRILVSLVKKEIARRDEGKKLAEELNRVPADTSSEMEQPK
jgi:hypothetical protein